MTAYRLLVAAVSLSVAACSPPEPARSAVHSASYPSPSRAAVEAPSASSVPTSVPDGPPAVGPEVRPRAFVARALVATVPSQEAELRRRYEGRRAQRVLNGRATYYHDDLAGDRTASGERYDPLSFTAAHRTLPFGTVLRVIRVSTGQDVFVQVNDRGPFGRKGVILDLSRAAAERVGLDHVGVSKVRIEVIEVGRRRSKPGARATRP